MIVVNHSFCVGDDVNVSALLLSDFPDISDYTPCDKKKYKLIAIPNLVAFEDINASYTIGFLRSYYNKK